MAPRRKLGEILLEQGAVSRADLDAALGDQSAGEPSRIGDILLSLGKITPVALGRALAKQHALPFVELTTVDPAASGLMPVDFLNAHKVVPFRVENEATGKRVCVAVADPTIKEVVAELESQTRLRARVYVAALDDIEGFLAALSGEVVSEGVVVDAALADPVQTDVTEVTVPHAPPTELLKRMRPRSGGVGAVGGTNVEMLVAASTPIPPPPPQPPSAPPPSAPPPAKSPSVDELFGSLDLEGPSATPVTLAPPSAPLPALTPAPPPSVPSPSSSPTVPRGANVLGRLALKRVAVVREPKPPGLLDGLELPEWMNAPVTERAQGVSEELERVLEAVVRGDLDAPPPAAMMAAVVRVLVSRGMLDEAALLATLGKK
ncbi:MAG: hypothetical protein K1X89_15660 [Myxococcaceae bacterium]|nr:hypothetical protein [Myxococcaceae bacterium]